MMRPLLPACLLLPLFAPTTASALEVEIQGKRLETQILGASCVTIEGNYPGIRIEASQSGKTARICYNSDKVNSISILDSTFIAVDPIKTNIVMNFEHEFPTGINGKIMARAKLQGFFSTANGVGVPAGDKLSITAFFSQAGHDDIIAEPFQLVVNDGVDSAVFDYSVKKQYLISGPRKLKGDMKIYFVKPGQKLTLTDRSMVSIDTGSTMADKLETMEQEEEENQPAKTPASAPKGGQGEQPRAQPAQPIPFPSQPGVETPPGL